MNNLTILAGVLLLVTLAPVSLYGQPPTGPYIYPVRPGMSEWKALVAHDEMQRVCQIPDATLKSLSTNDLIETCLDYPLYRDMFAYDFFQKGFESVVNHFNGLQELLRRDDASQLLQSKFNKMDPAAFDQAWSIEKKGRYGRNFYAIELLLSQPQILCKLRKDQRLALLRDCLNKASISAEYPQVYGALSLGTLVLLTGRIMLLDNVEPFQRVVSKNTQLSAFLQKANIPNTVLVREILKHAAEYAAQN